MAPYLKNETVLTTNHVRPFLDDEFNRADFPPVSWQRSASGRHTADNVHWRGAGVRVSRNQYEHGAYATK